MKRLFIAEKPSLAQAIYEGLGGEPNKKMVGGFYQIGDDKITSVFGHLLEIFDPENYDEKYKIWNLDHLPIKAVIPPKYKPKQESLDRLKLIEKLIQEDDLKEVISGMDIDAEGDQIFAELMTYFNYTKPTKRVLIADLNLKPVQKALANLRPNSEFENSANSALARSIGDQLFGYNLTRGYTMKAQTQGYGNTLVIGRIQTTLLGLVNSRTLANSNHEASYYYDISANFQSDNGLITAKYQPNDSDDVDEKNRIISENNANNVVSEITEKQAVIGEVKNTTEKKTAPLPYSLSALQQVCAKMYGYSSEETLEIVQHLYDNKYLTYPRSDCRYLSNEHFEAKDAILSALTESRPDLKDEILACSNNQHKAFDASKITAHHAICLTEKSIKGATLTEQQKNIYELVALSFIALFYPDSIREKTKATLTVNERTFTATQTILINQGWEVLFKAEIDTNTSGIVGVDLSSLKSGLSVNCVNQTIDKKKTTPPKYFVESSLLAAMTRAAKFVNDPILRAALEAKDKGNANEHGSIGTEATRAGILSKMAESPLITVVEMKGYKEKVWQTTSSGQEFCAALPPEIIAPDISAIWSGYQAAILQGKMSVVQFVSHVEEYISERIDHIKNNPLNITPNMEICPKCKTGFLKRLKGAKGHFYACSVDVCKSTYPETNGLPNLTPRAPQIVSSVHKCEKCNSGLTRKRKNKLIKGKPSFFWGCSAYPQCEQVYSERGGLPVFK